MVEILLKKRILLSVCVIVMGVFLLIIWWRFPIFEKHDFQMLDIPPGDTVHPGFIGVSFSLEKNDQVDLMTGVSTPISFVVVSNGSYWDWKTKYHNESVPNLMYDYENYAKGNLTLRPHNYDIVYDLNSFTVPTDGDFVLVFLNPRVSTVHVEYSADVTHANRIFLSTFAFYCGAASCLTGVCILAYFSR